MVATARRPEARLKARPELTELDRRDLPSFTTPVFTAVGPVSDAQPVDWAAVASVRVTSDIAETAGGTKVTVTLQDIRTDSNPVTVNLLTYLRDPANSAPPGDIKLQKLFAMDTAVLDAPGEIVTLTAALPACKSLYQADVSLGDLSPDVKASLIFPDTNIESVFGKVDTCSPPPCHTPPPPPCHTPPPPCHTPPVCTPKPPVCTPKPPCDHDGHGWDDHGRCDDDHDGHGWDDRGRCDDDHGWGGHDKGGCTPPKSGRC